MALRTTGNPEDAADALQDALISAFRRAESFRGDSAVTTWLHRIVVNACLDRLRRAKVRAADPLPDDLEEHARAGHVLAGPDAAADPEAHALAGDRRRRVLAALDELPPDQKAALVLVDMEGYPVAGGGRDPRGPHRHDQEQVRARPGPAGGAAGRPGPRPPSDPGTGTEPRPVPMRPNQVTRRETRPGDRPAPHPTSQPNTDPTDAHTRPAEEVSGHE